MLCCFVPPKVMCSGQVFLGQGRLVSVLEAVVEYKIYVYALGCLEIAATTKFDQKFTILCVEKQKGGARNVGRVCATVKRVCFWQGWGLT